MRKALWLIPALLAGMSLSARADTISPGTQIQVRADNPISVSKWDRGRIYRARVDRDVIARDGDVAIPAGTYAELIVRQLGPDRLALDLESVTVKGQRYVLDTSGPRFNTAEYQNGAGLVGSIIGAIAGVQAEGGQIQIPGGSVLTFNLRAPLHIVGWQDPGYDRDGNHYHRDPDWYR